MYIRGAGRPSNKYIMATGSIRKVNDPFPASRCASEAHQSHHAGFRILCVSSARAVTIPCSLLPPVPFEWRREWKPERREHKADSAMSGPSSEPAHSLSSCGPSIVDVEAQFRTRIASINECVSGAKADSRASTPRSSSPNVLSVCSLRADSCARVLCCLSHTHTHTLSLSHTHTHVHAWCPLSTRP